MHCKRCCGWMLPDQLMDLRSDTGVVACESWRCVNCGAIWDAVIEEHRRLRVPASQLRTRSKRRWRRLVSICPRLTD